MCECFFKVGGYKDDPILSISNVNSETIEKMINLHMLNDKNVFPQYFRKYFSTYLICIIIY